MSTIETMMMRWVWIAKAIIWISVGIVAWYAADRDPPFAVLSVEPASAHPGEVVVITAKVRREIGRKCSAEFTRYLFGANEARFHLDTGIASVEMIEEMERRTPGELRVAFQVPYAVTAGPARLDTVLEYRCNKVHRLWPIEVTTSLPFEVLP